MWSAAGDVLAFNAASPNYADLSPGLAYAILVSNNSDTELEVDMTVEGADAQADNYCVPDTWAPLDPVADCSVVVAGPATPPVKIVDTIPARTVCAYAAPCPKQFIRVTGAPADASVTVVVTRLRRNDRQVGTTTGGVEQFRREAAE